MTFSRAMLNNRHAKASPCFKPFNVFKELDRFDCILIWHLESVSYTHLDCELNCGAMSASNNLRLSPLCPSPSHSSCSPPPVVVASSAIPSTHLFLGVAPSQIPNDSLLGALPSSILMMCPVQSLSLIHI